MKIAIAQLNPTIGDLKGNAQRILEAAHQAVALGVRLMVTPELSLCGYPPRDLLLQPAFVDAIAITLRQLAQDLPPQLAVLVGTVERRERSHHQGGKPLFNSTALLEGGQIRQIFHKRLLPTYDVFDEDRYFEPGEQANWFALEVDGGDGEDEAAKRRSGGATEQGNLEASPPCSPPVLKIGVTICEDLWNDEEFWGKRTYPNNPIADLAALGVNFTINLSASPYTVGKQHLRELMLRHSAVKYHQPICYVNQVGGNDDLIFDGSSFGLNRQGELCYRARAFDSDLLIAEFDLDKQDFVIEAKAVAPQPQGDDAEIWSALVLGVRDYVQKCGFRKVVMGLSGGIDSSLVAAIAVAALGPENVLGVLMPSPYSSDHSIKDALALGESLGIRTETLPIGSLMESYDDTLKNLFADTEFGLAEENLQSRIRGNLLMAISNKFGHLLISTGNKSEMAVGYCTLYGDMNGGLAAIADVPKTRVYSICRWLNSGGWAANPGIAVIPENVLIKAPSAELKPGQVDQDSLPAYDVLDDILDRLVHQYQAPHEIVAAGHDAAVVQRVMQMVSRAEFKRKQAPPGLKITDRAFGTGWRMPIASRLTVTISAALATVLI